MSITISVVIPTHNRHKDLRRALKSVCSQTRLPDEIVVVDDASEPPVSDQVFANIPASITTKLVCHKTALGAAGARNAGIRAATKTYIAFLDDDDEFFPEKIQRVETAIHENGCPDIIYHPGEIFLLNEKRTYHSNPAHVSIDFYRTLLVSNAVGGMSMVVIKQSALFDAGLFDETLPALEDYELWIRMAQKGYRFYRLDACLSRYNYVSRKASVSKHYANNRIARHSIDKRYLTDIKRLSNIEKKDRKEAAAIERLQIALLNYQRGKSIVLAFKVVEERVSFRNLVLLFLCILGPRVVLTARSWLS